MRIITKNKFVYSDYDITDTLDVGIVLQGHEVKSIKTGSVNITDAIIREMKGIMIISNMDIPLYKRTHPDMAPGYDPKGIRTLLMTKRQITKRAERTHKTGLTIVPIELFETKNRLIKLKIGLGKLRKKIEKKQILKERDLDRQARRDIKNL